MDPQALTAVKGGINRLRTKGAAARDVLYDLANAYVTEAKTVTVRPGTFRRADLSAVGDTVGLCAFEGALHVFSTTFLGSMPAGFVAHVISHPDATPETPIALSAIEFAAPFLGYLYVVATFENGDTYHFWLQGGDTWQANHTYRAGDIVVPTVDTGFAYQASRLTPPNLSWAPSVLRTIGDVIEPTVYNDYYYTAVDTQGTNPRSGTVEPTWPTEDGAQVIEDADGSPGSDSAPTEPPDITSTPSPDIIDRYLRTR